MKLYRNSTEIADVKLTDSSYQDEAVMGENSISVEFYSLSALDIRKGDYCTAFSVQYAVKERPLPAMKKGVYHYQFKMYAPIHELEKVKMFLYDGSRDLTKSEFDYTCTPAQLLDMIVANLNAVQSFTWLAGTVISGDAKTITISSQNCLEVLQNGATEWETEYWTDGYTINLCQQKVEPDPPRLLTIGGGLLAIDQEKNINSKAITRLYAFGSTKNLPADYGSSRLKMDVPYLEIADATFVVEDVQSFDEVYPRRTGTVSEVREAAGIYYFKDSGLTFDPNDYELPGLVKHVVFQSGALVGLDFEANYNSTTAEFELIAYDEKNGISLPSSPMIPANSDTYILYNIEMPSTFKTAAEAELKVKAQAYLDANQDDLISLNLTIDELAFTRDDISLQLGEVVTVQADNIEPLTAGRNIRVTAFKRYLNKPNKYDSLKVSDVVYINPVSEVQNKTEEIEKVIERAGMNNPNYFARNWRDVAELANMIDTLQAEMLIVGKIENQFRLSGVFFTANKNGNKNLFDATAGQLIHSTIPTSEAPGTWEIALFSYDLPVDEAAFYLYARCSRTNNTGSFVISSTSIKYDSHNDYYYFLIGIISSVRGTARTFQTTYGFTQISGNQLVTGKMQTADGLNYLDFDNNKFKIGNSTAGLDWNATTPDTLTLKGALVQSPAGFEFPIGIFRGIYNAGFVYYKGDEVTNGGSSWIYINNTPASGQTPADGAYWMKKSAAGSDGIDGSDGVTASGNSTGGYIWRRAINGGAWTPEATTLILNYNFSRGGANIASRFIRITLNTTSGTLTHTDLGSSGESTSLSVVGNATSTISVTITHPASGAYVTQSVTTVEGGLNGVDGSNGTNGLDGVAGDFIEYRYAKNGSTTTPPSIVVTDLAPAGWSTTPPGCGALEYLWFTKAKKRYDGSILRENWSSPVRIKGENGADGANGTNGLNGAPGPLAMGGKDYSAGTTYYGNSTRVDIVKYSGTYYVSRVDAPGGSFSGVLPTNTSYWNTFGATFESVATDLFFANMAYIENLGVKYLRTGTSGERIFINGADGSMRFYDSSNNEVLTLDDGNIIAKSIDLKENIKEGIRQIDLDYSGQSGTKSNYLTATDFNVYYRLSGTPSSTLSFSSYLPLNPEDGKKIGILIENVSGSTAYGVFAVRVQSGDSFYPGHELISGAVPIGDSFFLKFIFKKNLRRWMIEGNIGITAGVVFYDRDNNLINMQFRAGALIKYQKTPT